MGSGKSVRVLLGLLLAVGVLVALIMNTPRLQYLEPLPAMGKLSPAIDIDVYVDGSGSMRNFLASGTGANTFREFLVNCEFALESGVSQGGWDQDKRIVRFWKFGPKGGPQLLNPNGKAGALHLLVNDPNQFNADNTSIEEAIEANPPHQRLDAAKLMIVITDLYQSDGKLERPGLALARRFLASEKGAVAVYGVRNPYQGNVTDLPGQEEAKIRLPNAATSMPFYILIGGSNAADVRHAQDLLTEGRFGLPLRQANGSNRLFASYFSRSAGRYSHTAVIYDPRVYESQDDHLLHFSTQPNPQPKAGEEGSAEPNAKFRTKFSALVKAFQPDHRDGVTQFDLVTRPLKQNVVGVSWSKDQTGGDRPIWQTEGAGIAHPTGWQISVFDCPVKKGTPGTLCPQAPQLDEKAAQGVHVCNSTYGQSAVICETGSGPEPALAVLIDRHYLTSRRKYLFEFDEVSSATSEAGNFDAGNALMEQWNFTPAEVNKLLTEPEGERRFPSAGSDHADEHPGKTPNLDQFLSALNGFVVSTGSGSGDTGVCLQTYFLYLNAR
jgi:hypothetical protein